MKNNHHEKMENSLESTDVKILTFLCSGKMLTGRDIQRLAHVGYYTARKSLVRLEKLGFIYHWRIGNTDGYEIREE